MNYLWSNKHQILQAFSSACLLYGISIFSFATTTSALEPPQANSQTYSHIHEQLKLSPNLRKETQPDFHTYRLGAGDTILATITPRSKDYSFNAVLDRQGNVSVPLVGLINLENMTIAEAQTRLQSALAEYLVNPQVGIVLGTARTTKVMMAGEIAKPGFYTLQDPRLPVALIEAGGITRFADLRQVTIRRHAATSETLEQQLDLFTMLKEGKSLADLRLMDGDIIQVPALKNGTVQNYDRELLAKSNLGQPKITIRVLDYSSGVSRVQIENGSDFLDALTAIKPNIERVDMGDLQLIRFNPETRRAELIPINAKKALKGDSSQNPTLEHNDVIVLERTWIAKFNYTLTQITQPFKDAFGFLMFFDSMGSGVSEVFKGDG
ncbi:MAG TPA: polysaccharide export protein [Leptolyngbyaceae cyanobacterium M33_DOE_097]|nr:polysaccharide export protein [Leptolyngbyaceae cyanobacterium M33_DOE_097]